MAIANSGRRRLHIVTTGFLLVAALALAAPQMARAATGIDGPIDLGTATPYGVLGASAVTNTGPSIITGDLGVSPNNAITGFPPGLISGAVHAADAVAIQAQIDLTTAMNTAASLTPTTSGLANLTGLSLTPGVYSGGAFLLDAAGTLTLAGSAESVWVFQAASTLTTGSFSQIVITGGASACNVFWLIGSSATLGTTSDFSGTIMAAESITATTGATIAGRLLASTGAVTLDSNTITAPTGCAPAGNVTESPVITSGPPADSTVGEDYSHVITATGTPEPTFDVTSGSLPPGLALDTVTGEVAGTPTTPGTFSVTVTVTNGQTPDASVTYDITTVPAAGPVPTAPTLPPTGADAALGGMAAVTLALGGVLLLFANSRRREREASAVPKS